MRARQISPDITAPLYYPPGAVGCACGDIGADNADVVVFHGGPQIWQYANGQNNVLTPGITRICFDPKMTSDQRWVAFVVVDGNNMGQIFVYDRSNNQQFQLTDTRTGSNRYPWVDYSDGDLWLGWLTNAVDLTPTKNMAGETAIIYRFRDGYLRVASWGIHGIFNGNVVTQAIVGRKTVFDSDATNTGYNNHGLRHVYLHDPDTMENLLISRNDQGVVLTTGESIQPRASANARRIMFQSRATEIVIPQNATAGNGEMFVSDLDSGKLYHCTPFYGESADGYISPDGRLIVFETNAPNVPGHPPLKPGTMNSFMYDLETGEYTMLNDPVPDDCTWIHGGGHPRVANDGSVVFNSDIPDGIWRVMLYTEPMVA